MRIIHAGLTMRLARAFERALPLSPKVPVRMFESTP